MTRHPFAIALAAFVASRVFTCYFVYAGHGSREYLEPVPGGWAGVENWWLNPWTTYDSRWFIAIAENGYDAATTAFFPLYPLLLRLGGDSRIEMALAGLLISNFAFLLALYLFYRLTRIDFGPKITEAGVWLLAFFPTTAFFSAVYSESLFLMLLLATFLAARRERWGLAGCFGMLAALCRNPGVLIFLALLLEYLRSLDYRRSSMRPSALAATVLPLIAFAAVQGYFWCRFGSPLAGIASQTGYHRAPGWPWAPLLKDITGLFVREGFPLLTLTHLLFIGLAIGLVIGYRKILPASYAILVLGILLMHLTYQRIIPVFTVGAVRYLSVAFPFTQLLSRSLAGLASIRPLLLAAICLYLFVGFIFSYQFGAKAFLG